MAKEHFNSDEDTVSTERLDLTISPDDRAFVESSETFLEEANVLRLEGRFFCFNPKRAKQQTGTITFDDGKGHGFEIEFHPNYGQPTVLAYRLVQAVFKKLTNEGPIFTESGVQFGDTVSFRERELARLAGRSGKYGRTTSLQLRDALRSVRLADIRGSFYDKGTDRWVDVEFSLFPEVYFARRRDGVIEACVIKVAAPIIKGLNNRHWVCFNWDRNMLCRSEIGMAMNKRLFYHFSNLYSQELKRLGKRPDELEVRKVRQRLVFEKNYTAICNEWLGGLLPLPYISQIKQKHGHHFDAVKRGGTIRSWKVTKRVNGDGFKLTFLPGRGFFADYERFYLEEWQPQLRFQGESDRLAIQQPIEMVTSFYCKLHNVAVIDADELEIADTEYAATLLDRYGVEGVLDLIDFAIEQRSSKTGFKIEKFRGLKSLAVKWHVTSEKRKQRREREAAEKRAEREEQLKLAYDRFRTEELNRIMEQLPAGQQTAVLEEATRRYRKDHPERRQWDNRAVQFTYRKVLAEEHHVDSFEEWKNRLGGADQAHQNS